MSVNFLEAAMFEDDTHFKGVLTLGGEACAESNHLAYAVGSVIKVTMITGRERIPQVELKMNVDQALKLAALIVAQAAAVEKS